MVQQQTTQNTQMKVVALAMKILGTKNEAELKTALSKMSEVGRTKFIQQCSNIIQTGDQSPESLQQAQQLAQMALEEGPEQDYAQMARHGASLRRYYFGGRVKTYDGNYMDLKKPLNKDQVEGRESIGVYKGQWMYLNGDKVAVPRGKAKDKGYDGTAHINRAYHGMLLPKPYKYGGGGFFNKVGDFFSNVGGEILSGVKQVPKLLKKGVDAIGNGIGKGMEWIQKGSNDLNEKYGMDIGGAINTLTNGLANTFDKPAFNTVGTLFDTLLTNTPPSQSTEAEEKKEKMDTEQGDGAAGATNGTPATSGATSEVISIEDMDKQKILNALSALNLDISDPEALYKLIRKRSESITQ